MRSSRNKKTTYVSKFFHDKEDQIKSPTSKPESRKARKSKNVGRKNRFDQNYPYKHRTYSLIDFESFASPLYENMCQTTTSTCTKDYSTLTDKSDKLLSLISGRKHITKELKIVLHKLETPISPNYLSNYGSEKNGQIVKCNKDFKSPPHAFSRRKSESNRSPFLENNGGAFFNETHYRSSSRRKSHSDLVGNGCTVLNKRRYSTSIFEEDEKNGRSRNKNRSIFLDEYYGYKRPTNIRQYEDGFYDYPNEEIVAKNQTKHKDTFKLYFKNDIFSSDLMSVHSSTSNKHKSKYSQNHMSRNEAFNTHHDSPRRSSNFDEDGEVFTDTKRKSKRTNMGDTRSFINKEDYVDQKIPYQMQHFNFDENQLPKQTKSEYKGINERYMHSIQNKTKDGISENINTSSINQISNSLKKKENYIFNMKERKRISEEFIKELNEELENYEKFISDENSISVIDEKVVVNVDTRNVIHKDNTNIENQNSLSIPKNVQHGNDAEHFEHDKNKVLCGNSEDKSINVKENRCANSTGCSDYDLCDDSRSNKAINQIQETGDTICDKNGSTKNGSSNRCIYNHIEINNCVTCTFESNRNITQKIEGETDEGKVIKMENVASDIFTDDTQIYSNVKALSGEIIDNESEGNTGKCNIIFLDDFRGNNTSTFSKINNISKTEYHSYISNGNETLIYTNIEKNIRNEDSTFLNKSAPSISKTSKLNKIKIKNTTTLDNSASSINNTFQLNKIKTEDSTTVDKSASSINKTLKLHNIITEDSTTLDNFAASINKTLKLNKIKTKDSTTSSNKMKIKTVDVSDVCTKLKPIEKFKIKTEDTPYTPPVLRNPKWIPPKSPHNLIEESLYNNPWGLLAATIFLNKTSCEKAYPYISEFLRDYPTPYDVLNVNPSKLERYFTNIGLVKRSVQVWRMSHDFINKNWMSVKELHGIGKYGSDAFQMFCLGNMDVEPSDIFLKIYKAWYKMFAENK